MVEHLGAVLCIPLQLLTEVLIPRLALEMEPKGTHQYLPCHHPHQRLAEYLGNTWCRLLSNPGEMIWRPS